MMGNCGKTLVIALFLIALCLSQVNCVCDRETIRSFIRQCSHYMSKRSVNTEDSFMGRLTGRMPQGRPEEQSDVMEYDDSPPAEPLAKKMTEVLDQFIRQEVVVAKNGLYRRRSHNVEKVGRSRRDGKTSLSCNIRLLNDLCARKK